MVIESGDHAGLRCLPPGPAAISRILPVPPGTSARPRPPAHLPAGLARHEAGAHHTPDDHRIVLNVDAMACRAGSSRRSEALAVFCLGGLAFVNDARVSPAVFPSAGAIVYAGALIFLGCEGFDLIANASEDARDPGRALPQAHLIARRGNGQH